MYSFGYPIAKSAVLGSFSTIQKAGRQAKAQGQFALMGSLARVIMPVLSGYVEQYVEETGSYELVLLLMAISLMGVAYMNKRIQYFTGEGAVCRELPDYKQNVMKGWSFWELGLMAFGMVMAILAVGSIADWIVLEEE